jgi:hypothetical protein
MMKPLGTLPHLSEGRKQPLLGNAGVAPEDSEHVPSRARRSPAPGWPDIPVRYTWQTSKIQGFHFETQEQRAGQQTPRLDTKTQERSTSNAIVATAAQKNLNPTSILTTNCAVTEPMRIQL